LGWVHPFKYFGCHSCKLFEGAIKWRFGAKPRIGDDMVDGYVFVVGGQQQPANLLNAQFVDVFVEADIVVFVNDLGKMCPVCVEFLR